MGSKLLTRGDLIVDDVTRKAAATALSAAGDEAIEGVSFQTETGRTMSVEPALADLLAKIVARVAQGGRVHVTTLPEQLTTSAAADLLGVSRTTVMKWIASGELPSTKAGTHHRLRQSDVIALRKRREKRRAALLEELLLLDEDT